MNQYCFGIDVGGTTIKIGFFDLAGEILDKWEMKTRTEANGVNILPDIAAFVQEKIDEKQIVREDIAGIGIGVPGPVNEDGEVQCAVNLHWGYINPAVELGKSTNLKIKVGNDANVAALGEMWKGGGAGSSDIMMITLGTGVGGGIVTGGRIITGSHGAAGEIGHVPVSDEILEPCNCGNRGCLEQVASATGIVYLAHEVLGKSAQGSLLRQGEISAKAVFDAVKQGDELAQEVAERFGRYLGRALATFASVVDPEVFVIGGGVSKAGPIILDYIRKYYQRYAFSSCKDARFALAELGNDAGMYGAAKLLLTEK